MAFHQNAQAFGIVTQHVAHAEIIHRARTLRGAARSFLGIGSRRNRQQIDLCVIDEAGEVTVRIIDIGDPAAHPRSDIASGLAQHNHYAAGHVFAGVIASAFDHRQRARIAHGETFTRDAVEICLPRDRAIEHGVADDDVVLRGARRGVWLAHDDAPAR